MKKWTKRIILGVVILIFILSIGAYWFLSSSKPLYSGNISGLTHSPVDVFFDDFGVPHIYATDTEDLYRAFGYVQAQERLFQMELMRRVGAGKLSEILGDELIETDKLFRTIVDPGLVKRAVETLESEGNQAENNEVEAYLEGINYFIDQGSTPPEFSLKSIEKTHFSKEDLFYIASYMAYGFALGQRTDPIADKLNNQLGSTYLDDLGLHNNDSDPYIPSFDSTDYIYLSQGISATLDNLPVPVFSGSNSWVVSGQMTKSGKPILCNDTHIAYTLPQTWYEAHLVGPDIDIYGYFLGGIPYALVGNTPSFAWGLTMLEQDDMDFYREQLDETGTKYLSKDIWFETHERTETITTDNGDSTQIVVRSTHHGPIVSDFFNLPDEQDPISLWWDYTKYPNELLPAFRGLNHAKNIQDAELAASKIHGPGLNLTAADTAGNIGWWACAKLLKRAPHVNSKLILRGTGEDEPLGVYPFEKNPKAVNPPWNFVYSANDQPAAMDSLLYPGYYKPSHRADRIKEMITSRNDWTQESMKMMMTDVISNADQECAHIMAGELSELDDECIQLLASWDGSHEISAQAPTIYYAFLHEVLDNALKDEMGDETFDAFLSTHWMKRGYLKLLSNPDSYWWDDARTPEQESRKDILTRSWATAKQVLSSEYGDDYEDWTWGLSHTLKLEHPFGKVAILSPLFNISPEASRGGFETINQAGFKLNGSGHFETRIGSQMRIILDLADIDQSITIAPSGQSGHPLSPHYDDQAEMHRLGLFRNQIRLRNKVEKSGNLLHFDSF